jgi:hypothetical protein
MAVALEAGADTFKIVKLAVDDDAELSVFIGDGLVAACQIDDAQPRMSKAAGER